ncbi:hypothetical protein [Faecalibaculum rodentium]|uniref:hypothetical protein n=1 Tax=Faecalibaculum rodentium TaxID=1702221 RepID=UPI0026CD9FA9
MVLLAYGAAMIWELLHLLFSLLLVCTLLALVFSEEFRASVFTLGGMVSLGAGLLLWVAVNCGAILVLGVIVGLREFMFEQAFG